MRVICGASGVRRASAMAVVQYCWKSAGIVVVARTLSGEKPAVAIPVYVAPSTTVVAVARRKPGYGSAPRSICGPREASSVSVRVGFMRTSPKATRTRALGIARPARCSDTWNRAVSPTR